MSESEGTTRTFIQEFTESDVINLSRYQDVRSVLFINKGSDVANIELEGDPYPLETGSPVGESLELGTEEVEPYRSDNVRIRFQSNNNPRLFVMFNYTHY